MRQTIADWLTQGKQALLYCGEAAQGLRAFVSAGGKARVAYLDPPFLTGKDFGAYRDDMAREGLLALLREALCLCRDALAVDGSLYLHVDHRLSAHARLLLDEVFGQSHFMNEIIWAYQSGGRSRSRYSRKHDTIYLYRRGARALFQPEAVGAPRGQARANHMRRGVDELSRGYTSIQSAGKEYRYYDDELVPPGDVWTDIAHLQQRDPERTGYPTQKPLKLLERILLASSREGDIILDPFCGSGTTLEAAHRLGRRAYGVDSSSEAEQVVRRRMEGRLVVVSNGEASGCQSLEKD